MKHVLIALALIAGTLGAVVHPVTAQAVDPEFAYPGRVVFVSDRGGTPQIYTMDGDGANVEQVTEGPDAHYYPIWSPDGTRILHVSNPAMGSSLRILSLDVIDADGSNRVTIFQETELLQTTNFSDWSPDGEHIAFMVMAKTAPDDVRPPLHLYVASADGTGARQVDIPGALSAGQNPRWSPDGRLIVATSKGDLYVADADGSNVERWLEDMGHAFAFLPGGGLLTGSATRGVVQRAADGTNPRPLFDLPDNSVLYRLAPAPGGDRILTTYSATSGAGNGPGAGFTAAVYDGSAGGLRALTDDPYTVWSPDGRYLAYTAYGETDGRYQVMVLDLATGERTQITPEGSNNSQPDWVGDANGSASGSRSGLDTLVYEPSIWG